MGREELEETLRRFQSDPLPGIPARLLQVDDRPEQGSGLRRRSAGQVAGYPRSPQRFTCRRREWPEAIPGLRRRDRLWREDRRDGLDDDAQPGLSLDQLWSEFGRRHADDDPRRHQKLERLEPARRQFPRTTHRGGPRGIRCRFSRG